MLYRSKLMHSMTKIIFSSRYQVNLAAASRMSSIIETTDSMDENLNKSQSFKKKRLIYATVAEFIAKLEASGR